MRFKSPIVRKHARIEIIPLIDIMFFLLASFMMVSLNMTKIENISVALPRASQTQVEFPPDMVDLVVDKSGGIWVEKVQLTIPELYTVLTNRFRQNEKLPVYIGGDADTHHGDMVQVLECVRNAGFQRISFTTTTGPGPRHERTP